jgi:putative ABC transport system permease protein
VLLSGFSFLLGVALVAFSLPFFNELTEKSLSIPWRASWFLPVMAFSSLIIGLIAGLYPSFYLSAFQPIRVLKGDFDRGGKNASLRSTLVVFQFATSVVLIVSTLVVLRQMNFILHKRLGFDKDQVMLLQGTQTLGRQLPAFKNELRQISGVKSVSISDYLPITGSGTKRNGNTFWEVGKDKNADQVVLQKWEVDHDYIRTLGLNIVEGRDFSPDMPSDSQAVVINQALAKKLHFEQAVGKQITNEAQTLTVIGVVEDFHFESVRGKIRPAGLILGNSPTITAVKINAGDMAQTVGAVTGLWKKMAPNQAIRYTFLDEGFARMYTEIQRTGHIFTIFAAFAIFVACLGLFALSSYMAERRTKEISIRKVLGASVGGIAGLLAKDFLKLILIAIFIASPVGYYFMQKWLADFPVENRIELHWWMFAAAGAGAILIALLTVGGQAVRAALANPVKSLGSE